MFFACLTDRRSFGWRLVFFGGGTKILASFGMFFNASERNLRFKRAKR